MSLTYSDNRPSPHGDLFEPTRHEEPFVPVYARPRGSGARKGGVKTWMILAPVGVLLVGGVAAVMMMSGAESETAAPVLEPAATAPVLPATAPLSAASVEVEPIDAAPVAVPPPVVRREAAPVRRAAPAQTQVREPAPAVREAPAPAPATAVLNAEPTAAPAPVAPAAEPPPPAIVVQPLN